jgi:hypothetical protein
MIMFSLSPVFCLQNVGSLVGASGRVPPLQSSPAHQSALFTFIRNGRVAIPTMIAEKR